MAEIDRRLREPYPCDPQGMRLIGSSGYSQPAWTPLGFLRRGEVFKLACACGARFPANVEALVARGYGDYPMPNFSGHWICPACGGKSVEAVR